jgi:Raf kinase inhibitor-like YbhB/YbcL family protein
MLRNASEVLLLFLLLMLSSLANNCTGNEDQTRSRKEGIAMAIQLTSSAFTEGASIPTMYTCDGKDVSPPLKWSNVPEGTKSFALISDDPDAPVGTWVHWVIYDIPAEVTELPEAVPTTETLANGAKQGRNDFKRIGYGGPCPPRGGPHRYFFKLYALDSQLGLKPGATKKELLKAMEGHILAEGQLMGTYQRK